MSEKVTNLANKLHDKTIDTLKKLDHVWDEIGLDDEIREQRHQMFYDHVSELYNDMLMEAESSKSNLLEQLESIGKELFSLGRDLRMNIDVAGCENMPLYKAKEEMKNKLKAYQDIFNAKKAEINKLIAHQKNLCHSLGKPIRELAVSPLPTQDEINEFQTHLEELSDLKFSREEEFLKLKARIISIMDELKINPSLDFERKVVNCEDSAFRVTDENMDQLRDLHKSLESQLQETKIKISELREQISNLWEKLEESPQVRSAFLEANHGSSIPTLKALKEELHKLEERKKANIKLFVDKLRQELANWWDKCCFSREQREEFIHFDSDCYTEDLLTLHELQVEKVKKYYEKNISLVQILSEDWKEHQKDKKDKLSVKKKERDCTSNPCKSTKHSYTPVVSTSKRKLFTPTNEVSKRSRFDDITSKSSIKPPNISKAKSVDRERRLAKIKRRSHAQKVNDTNYEVFENDLEGKPFCRSSITSDRVLRSTKYPIPSIKVTSGTPRKVLNSNGTPVRVASSNGTPRKAFGNVNSTPQKTPRPGMRPKSPTFITPRLAVAPNNLPIII